MDAATLNSAKAGLWTALWTFIGTFALLTLTPWVGDVAEWAAAEGSLDFPDLDTLAYGAVAALTSAASGFIGFVVRVVQGHTSIPGGPPVYGTPPPYEG
jgi:formate hydrogenlyase subunit 3/multisubunit Na+/H+ antiporter MnhD subunit